MKKSIVLIIAVMATLILALVGCAAKPVDAIESTQKAWDASNDKVATDKIVIKDVNLGELIYIKNVEASLKRTFKDGKVTAEFNIGKIALDFGATLNNVLAGLGSALPAGLNIETIKANIGQVSVSGKVELTENNTMLNGSISIKGINDVVPGLIPADQLADLEKIELNSYNAEEDKWVPGIKLNYGEKDQYADAIKKAINLILSHFGATIFQPAEDGAAEFSPAKLNEILVAFVTYSDTTWPQNKVGEKISNIAGVDYKKILTEKIEVENPTFEGKVKKGLITDMTVAADKIKILYNKAEFGTVVNGILSLIDNIPSLVNTAVPLVLQFAADIDEEHCIEIGNISVTSTYTINA